MYYTMEFTQSVGSVTSVIMSSAIILSSSMLYIEDGPQEMGYQLVVCGSFPWKIAYFIKAILVFFDNR